MDVSRVIWRKSSHSGEEYACVETAALPGAVGIRDSKDPAGPKIFMTGNAWRALHQRIRSGLYDT